LSLKKGEYKTKKMTDIKETTKNPAPPIGNWNEQKAKLKSKFTILTDADMDYEHEKKNEMYDKIQIKLGKTKEEFAALMATL
jgi:hypothetical protein